MTWNPNPALSLLCDVGMLCPPRETGMKIKADDAQRCLGTERGIEDAPASRRLPALSGCSGSSPRARRPRCAEVWLGPPPGWVGAAHPFLHSCHSVGRRRGLTQLPQWKPVLGSRHLALVCSGGQLSPKDPSFPGQRTMVASGHRVCGLAISGALLKGRTQA